MSRWSFIVSKSNLAMLHSWLDRAAALGMRVEFKAAKRSLPQNDKMWAMLTDVANQCEWDNKRRTPHQWKDLFTGSVKAASGDLEIVPGLTGGFMILGLHTSDMTKAEMADLITWMQQWGDERGVVWSEPTEQAA